MKKIYISLVFLFVLVSVFLFLIAPLLMQQLNIEELVTKKINEQFGREISFSHLRMGFLPMPTVKIKDLRLKEKDIFAEDDLAYIETVFLRIDVFALFSKQIKIEKFIFDGVSIFIREKDAKSNLKELIVDQAKHVTEKKRAKPAPMRPVSQAAQQRTKVKEPLDLVISELLARDITIFYEKRQSGALIFEDRLVIRKGDLKNFGFFHPVDFEFEIVPSVSPKPLMVTGTFSLDPQSVLDSLTVEAHVKAEQVRIKELALKYLENSPFALQDGFLSLDIMLAKKAGESSLGVKGQISAEKVYVSTIESLGKAVPLMNATVDIDSIIDLPFDEVRVNSFQARLGATTITADGTVNIAEKKLSLAVSSSSFDLADVPVLQSYLKQQFPDPVNIEGPVLFNVFIEGNYFSQHMIGNIDLVNAELLYADMYRKPKGFPVGLEVNCTAEAFNSLVGSFDIHFGSMTMKGDLRHLDLRTHEGEFSVHTNKFMLDSFSEQLFFTQEYIVNGKAKFFCNVRGKISDILRSNFKFDCTLDDVSIAHEYIQLQGLNGAFIVDPYAIEINNVDFSIFQSDFKGWAKLEDYQKKPNLNFDLYSARCNLDSLLPAYDLLVHDLFPTEPSEKEDRPPKTKTSPRTVAQAVGQASAAPVLPAQGKADIPAERDPFRYISGEGAFYIEELVYLQTPFDQLKGVIQMKDGNIRLANATINAFAGSVWVDGEVTVAEIPMLYACTGKATDINLDRVSAFLHGPAQPSMVDGTASCALTLSGAGFSLPDVEKNLQGYGTVFVKDGELKNIDLLKAVSTAQQFLGLRTHAYGGTRFQDITANFVIADGKLKTDDIYLASEELTVSSAGTVSVRGALDLNVDVLLAKKVAEKVSGTLSPGQTMSIPIHIGGTIEKPTYSVVGAAVRKIVDQFIQKGLSSLLRKVDVQITQEPAENETGMHTQQADPRQTTQADDASSRANSGQPPQFQDDRASDKEILESAIRTGLDLLLKK